MKCKYLCALINLIIINDKPSERRNQLGDKKNGELYIVIQICNIFGSFVCNTMLYFWYKIGKLHLLTIHFLMKKLNCLLFVCNVYNNIYMF